jgi:hypothetical protein
MIARVVAPNLTAAVHQYSDAEFAVIIRNGVRPGGRSMVVMPSEVFVGLPPWESLPDRCRFGTPPID